MTGRTSFLPDGFKIIEPNSEDEWKNYYDIRYEVLRKPWNQQPQSTRDEWEDRSVHLLVISNSGEGIATGRLQLNSETEGQIRSMAVLEKFRNMHIGHAIIQRIEEEARSRGIKTITLDAREPALNFYLKNNYTVVADSYLLFGVIKHFSMKKILDDN